MSLAACTRDMTRSVLESQAPAVGPADLTRVLYGPAARLVFTLRRGSQSLFPPFAWPV